MYTVISQSGHVQASGVSVRGAAQEVLGYDGHEYEFRRDGDWLELWASRWSRNSTLGGKPLVRAADMFARGEGEAAENEIFAKVIQHADRWNGLTVVSDETYAREHRGE